MSTSRPKPRRKLAIRVAALLLVALLVDRYLVPRFVLGWLDEGDVVFHDAFIPAVGGTSPEEAAHDFAWLWLRIPGQALAYVSRNEELGLDHLEYREPLLPEAHRMFGPVWKRENVKLVSLSPASEASGRAFLATVKATDSAETRDFRFLVVQGRRGRWFVAAEGLKARTRRYTQEFNELPRTGRGPDTSHSATTGEPELDFSKD